MFTLLSIEFFTLHYLAIKVVSSLRTIDHTSQPDLSAYILNCNKPSVTFWDLN